MDGVTVPDPGLTDFIAAHQAGDRWTDFTYPSIFSDKPFVATTVTKMVNCSCGEAMTSESHPAHVASVSKQHTNGRIAELEAENRTLTFSVEDETRDCEGWKIRAEKAEATIARVEKLQRDLFQQGGNLIAQWGAARLIRAALEGERQ